MKSSLIKNVMEALDHGLLHHVSCKLNAVCQCTRKHPTTVEEEDEPA